MSHQNQPFPQTYNQQSAQFQSYFQSQSSPYNQPYSPQPVQHDVSLEQILARSMKDKPAHMYRLVDAFLPLVNNAVDLAERLVDGCNRLVEDVAGASSLADAPGAPVGVTQDQLCAGALFTLEHDRPLAAALCAATAGIICFMTALLTGIFSKSSVLSREFIACSVNYRRPGTPILSLLAWAEICR